MVGLTWTSALKTVHLQSEILGGFAVYGGVPLGFVNSDTDPPSLRMLCSKQDGFGGFVQKTSSLIVASAQQQSGMSSSGGKRFSDSILGNAMHT
jgi:hypothetical protein